MIRKASALIIGIEKYDQPLIPTLHGCAYDAQQALAWLRAIGVPDENIYLHSSPSDAGAKFDDKDPWDARADTILESIEALGKGSGDQLFLFFSGHGLNVPGMGGGPVFLAQDYDSGLAKNQKNFRMEAFIKLFASWNYSSQFLFYDACQNPSANIGRISLLKPFEPAGLDALPVNPPGALLACYAAAPGETAWAGEGKGVLMRHVLDALDPTSLAKLGPDDDVQTTIVYDWQSGDRQLDLLGLFRNYLAGAISAEARAHGNTQNPNAITAGRGIFAKYMPVLDLGPDKTNDLTIVISPPEAIGGVGRIRVAAISPPRNLRLPDDGGTLPGSISCKGPADAQVRASCEVVPGSDWVAVDSPQLATLDAPRKITLTLAPAPPPMVNANEALDSTTIGRFNIRLNRSNGDQDFSLGGSYDGIAGGNKISMVPPDGVSFRHHEYGPDFWFNERLGGARESAARYANEWLHAIRREVGGRDLTASLFPPGVAPVNEKPNVRFVFDGPWNQLGGFMTRLKAFTITEIGAESPIEQMTLRELELHPRLRLAAGVYRAAISLPWGDWSVVIRPDDGKMLEIALPSAVGRPPLRNRWLESIPPGRSNFQAPAGRFERLALRVEVDAEGGQPRAEPFSQATLPEWDLLFSAGRFDLVAPERIHHLILNPLPQMIGDERPLLMLGLAHAAYAHGDKDALDESLNSVSGRLATSLDHRLLENALCKMTGKRAPISADEVGDIASQQTRTLLSVSASLLTALCGELHVPLPGWLLEIPAGSTFASIVAADIQR